jgi:hypothetical protein
MPQAKKNKSFSAEIKFTGIELLKSAINIPSSQDIPLNNFNFNINIESKGDAEKKLLFVIVNVEVKSFDQKEILGLIITSCIYEITKFTEFVEVDSNGAMIINPQLVEILNSISISTTRGAMFTMFKGTYLHQAILPIIDPKSFLPV